MATGDLKGNLRKIEQGLRHLNYPRDVNYTGLAKGDPSVFLPIISYCFTSFSTHITELLVESDVELTAKNDLRFIEAVYKLLRDQFQYKPILSKQQFLHCGFAERKIQIVCDIISLVYKRDKELSSVNKVKSQARKRTCSIKPQPKADCSNHLDSAPMDFPQDISLIKKPGSAHSRSLISSFISKEIVRDVLKENKTEAVCVADGLDTIADRLNTMYEQCVSLGKKAGVECSRSLISACITGDIDSEVLDKEENEATCVAYGLDSGTDRLDSVCEQGVTLTKKPEIKHSRSLISACIPGDIVKEVLEEEKNEAICLGYCLDSGTDKDTKEKNEMEKLMSRIAELEEKLNKLNWMEDKFQALEEKLQGKIIVDEKDWENLLSRVLLLETQMLLHSKNVDLSTDLNNLGEENMSAHDVSPVSPDREKEDLPESYHQSSGYSSQLSTEPSPRATVVNNHGLSEVSKDTTRQRMERISKIIEETSELLKTSSNTS
ncbi:centrosomal protein of 44 kDa isoform X2 [Sceloporus undulatus]|uniref:centrosomal protein of 44 kDa isoform X2 n=1 Tax=Sceloporus undulatus TaxID=8520 RepID=UPI001C4C2EEB|nr:centrosomal protein of 44 kDa isoform X2 [Sceloporus undulatus]